MASSTRPGSGSLSFPEGWSVDSGNKRAFLVVRTKDFMAAVGLVERIAEVAEELNHHPDLHLTNYRDLRIETTSHDAGSLTERDVRLAERIDALLKDAGLKKG